MVRVDNGVVDDFDPEASFHMILRPRREWKAKMARELSALIARYGLKAHVAQFGSVFVVYFMEPPVESYTDILRNDNAMDVEFRRSMIERGIFMMPLALKRNHLTAAHTEKDMALTLEAAGDVFRTLGRN